MRTPASRRLAATAAVAVALSSLAASGVASAATAAGATATGAASTPTAYVVVPGSLVPVNIAGRSSGTPIAYKGATIRQLVATPDHAKLYGADGFGVIPFDVATQTAEPRLNFHRVQAIAVTPNGKTLFVAAGALRVYPVSTATDKPGPPIKIHNNAFAIAITPNGKTLYAVGNFEIGEVTPVNIATRRPAAPSMSAGSPARSPSRRTGRRPTSPATSRAPSPRSAPPPTGPARPSGSRTAGRSRSS